ncbi:hypothetical protein AB4144_23925, partial [Rhizobiaceae sp. 2RAB30]
MSPNCFSLSVPDNKNTAAAMEWSINLSSCANDSGLTDHVLRFDEAAFLAPPRRKATSDAPVAKLG